MIKTTIHCIIALLSITSALAFVQPSNTFTTSSRTFMTVNDVPPAQPTAAVIINYKAIPSPVNSQSSLSQGTSKFLDSSSNVVSVQEYRKPTAEEIAAKKRNFNLWFWGGGIVAPFLATFYYFGLKFWEK
mmetsp:Transcript_828/g.1290  ORF Transcript_828/g.1290 Transcript_828/m.1290 type:complete len:130 (+) Transcript_828:97-486(+)